MWGAVIGDLTGSIYEFNQFKNTRIIPTVSNFIVKDSFFSDDTILTVAVYDAIRNNCEYEKYLRIYARAYIDYVPNTSVTDRFKGVFSKGFERWVAGLSDGTSAGNGAMMRISGVGKIFKTESDVLIQAKNATIPSHNSQEAIKCAQTVALVIYYAERGMDKFDILNKIGIKYLTYKPFERFNRTCSETIDNCLYAAFSQNNFESALAFALSMGADTDTNCAIVGAMAEALYGVPSYLVNQAREKIPYEFSKILDSAY